MPRIIASIVVLGLLIFFQQAAWAIGIVVAWNDGANETLYRVQQSTDGGTTWSDLGTTAANVTTFTQTSGFTEGQQYCVRVRGENGTLLGQYSASQCSTPNTPPQVTGLTVNWTP